MKDSQTKKTSTIEVPQTLLNPSNEEFNFLNVKLADHKLFGKKYTLRELMDLKDSLEEDEFNELMIMRDAMEFNVNLIKETIDVSNGPVKILIYQRSDILIRIKLMEGVVANLQDEGNNMPLIGRVTTKIDDGRARMKMIDALLNKFNSEVKVTLDLLDLKSKTGNETKKKEKASGTKTK